MVVFVHAVNCDIISSTGFETNAAIESRTGGCHVCCKPTSPRVPAELNTTNLRYVHARSVRGGSGRTGSRSVGHDTTGGLVTGTGTQGEWK